ncbi:MAG: prepilin-type N-terminal cleavage/methylation domain-containing protein [Gammaproteobacteria bacterium]|uniref:GspH/FimT family pseudopilin n=1 Tax=Pseudomaricurvus alcaniphilus TaxID=1166482 RepID=UPI00140BF984|nr:GspH/FimT family pseudopilin [Pseudomaricurvus alcaniphilus]MBR9913104.1 prepilin-type N-terminal cleavage/methylation domain-containing protein [Gammaproteobacteria bacterium]NHN39303.1 prepilin-type N-terminal cleavage/methylation domain-containing protein [Pseudomaricurvus alcaniphilus]
MKIYRGFTLPELLFTLAIAGLLGLIAAPSFLSTGEAAGASAAAGNIHRALQHARTLAKMQARRLYICGSDNGSECNKEWGKMMLLFEDKNDDKLPDSDELVQKYLINARHSVIQTRLGFGKKLFSYNNLGRVDLTGSFLVCAADHSPEPVRKITWNATGRPYVLKTATKVAAHSDMTCSG